VAGEHPITLDDERVVEDLAAANDRIMGQLAKVIVGQQPVIEDLLIALFARGHCLLVGVPGLAKTLLISTLARVLDLHFTRIQFTPDVTPTDILGTPEAPGPIFTQLLLADEINRTPPKTQSALLQAMQEYAVTSGGKTFPLDLPFFVLATQNPIEQEGTYPLPEAQLDRFMFNISVEYPDLAQEVQIIETTTSAEAPALDTVLDATGILALQRLVRRVVVPHPVAVYAATLVQATRPSCPQAPAFVKEWVNWGAGPRASQYLILGAKARAVLRGRFAAAVEDVQALARSVLRHRIISNFAAEAERVTSLQIIDRLLAEIPVEDG
jgi:MoxR-like ATPase